MFAEIIIDLKAKSLDRPFTYKIPETLEKDVVPGVRVLVPFGAGNKERSGFVTAVKETAGIDETILKPISAIAPKSHKISEELQSLAIWMRHRYGGTLFQAMSTVLLEKQQVEVRKEKYLVCNLTSEELNDAISICEKKKFYAKYRLLNAFLETNRIPYSIANDRLNIGLSTVQSLEKAGLISVDIPETQQVDHRVIEGAKAIHEEKAAINLNDQQKEAVRSIEECGKTTSLLFGITGSGKTEVYLQLIEDVLKEGKQAIVLIPEISLTYQTVMRFYDRFGDRVSVVHSKLSKGEKSERFSMAEDGRLSVMIGPRSALFTPFKNLGIVIVDEFHDQSYESEQVPKYKAVEVAEKRCENEGAKLVLGSATPSTEVYARALNGEINIVRLTKRASDGSVLPDVTVVDLREELQNKNRSIFSRLLQEKIKECLQKQEQVMLFLNRRGYSGAVSCRACGEPIKCPHCSVSLNMHRNGKLKCHLCGYERVFQKICPKCGSNLIGAFGTGTEKVEEEVLRLFPGVRTLRMDADTTEGKDGHEKIIEAFSHHEADILIGTQMIVKGHDFPEVTLVGILAADLSLMVPDYRSSERTFQLLCQAEGRAGRRGKKGECIIQTYNPEHYAITTARDQDFESFFANETTYRKTLKYPPYGYLFGIRMQGLYDAATSKTLENLTNALKSTFPEIRFLGPSEDNPARLKDQYRFIVYYKGTDLQTMLKVKKAAEEWFTANNTRKDIYMTIES